MSARTLEKTRMVMLPSADLRAAIRRDPDLAMAAMAELATSYRVMVRHAKNLKLRTARERLAAWIMHQSVQAGGALAFTLPVEKRHLASYFGVTPESLSRTIRTLREDGVTVDGMRIIITDAAKLRDLAGLDPILDGGEIKDGLL